MKDLSHWLTVKALSTTTFRKKPLLTEETFESPQLLGASATAALAHQQAVRSAMKTEQQALQTNEQNAGDDKSLQAMLTALENLRRHDAEATCTIQELPDLMRGLKHVAERIMKEGGDDAASRIRWAFEEALSRPANDRELRLVSDLQAQQLKRYRADGAAARELLTVGIRPAPEDLPAAELASWTAVARTILNLHETITRQ